MYFFMYLRSMENMYNLIVPTDEALLNYREPISWQLGGASRRIWEFYYDESKNAVYADIYSVDENGEKAELVRQEKDQNNVRNRLRDIIDMNIVIGTNDNNVLGGYINDSNANYFLTKGGATIYATGKGANVVFNGGGDMELGLEPAHVVLTDDGRPCMYDAQNGRTFFVDHILHDPVKNVYDVLGEHPEFSRFFELCLGDEQVSTNFIDDEDFVDIFGTKYSKEAKICGIGNVVNNFNNYRYTILVPTNEAIDAAFAADPNLWTWEKIAAEEDMTIKKEKALYLLSFLRYHFVDNSAYISGEAYGPLTYESGSRNAYDRFRRLTVSSNGKDMTIVDESGKTSKVLTSTGCYNFMARDIIGNAEDPQKATQIFASSRAVIHLIDRALTPKN
ncbi:MAG: fasciclin domain-containing protein [Bacteroidales bacterium]|nr:fasciclin domain-containing protein [Bacteroidales bacterium]